MKDGQLFFERRLMCESERTAGGGRGGGLYYFIFNRISAMCQVGLRYHRVTPFQVRCFSFSLSFARLQVRGEAVPTPATSQSVLAGCDVSKDSPFPRHSLQLRPQRPEVRCHRATTLSRFCLGLIVYLQAVAMYHSTIRPQF